MSLKITGLVEHTIDIPPRNTRIARIDRIEDFHCLEGWVRPDQSWSGLPLDQLIRLAKPRENGRFIEIASGDFVAVLSLSDLDQMVVLLADTQNGCKLTQSNGGLWRLIVSGAACYYGVKNVDRISVVADRSGETARTLALARLESGSDTRLSGSPPKQSESTNKNPSSKRNPKKAFTKPVHRTKAANSGHRRGGRGVHTKGEDNTPL